MNHLLDNIFNFVNFVILANFPYDVVKELPKEVETGVYFGWASIGDGKIYKAVLNIGWCPFYDNKQKSVV